MIQRANVQVVKVLGTGTASQIYRENNRTNTVYVIVDSNDAYHNAENPVQILALTSTATHTVTNNERSRVAVIYVTVSCNDNVYQIPIAIPIDICVLGQQTIETYVLDALNSVDVSVLEIVDLDIPL
jgi:hypothetical protein